MKMGLFVLYFTAGEKKIFYTLALVEKD